MKYRVTVKTEHTFFVEASNKNEASERALEDAELHNGNFYEWEVDEIKETRYSSQCNPKRIKLYLTVL